jgi:hypothetical protein
MSQASSGQPTPVQLRLPEHRAYRRLCQLIDDSETAFRTPTVTWAGVGSLAGQVDEVWAAAMGVMVAETARGLGVTAWLEGFERLRVLKGKAVHERWRRR